MTIARSQTLTLCLLWLAASPAFAQEASDPGALRAQRMFAERERKALAEPFVGLRTDEKIIPGLFPIRSTGVSTEPIRKAAEAFLGSLSAEQRSRTTFAIDSDEWRKWSNVDNGIYARQGVSLREMSPAQRQAANALLSASLSAEGLALTEAIRKTDQTLRELNNNSPSFDEDLYFFTLMGTPSPTAPWGWQLDGHHLIINYFVLGDQVVMTPAFFGGEPVRTTTGKYAGNVILQAEQDQGLALVQSLNPEQLKAAVLASRHLRNGMKAGAGADNLVLPYDGVSVRTFDEAQRAQLLELIALFVNNMAEGHARVRMSEIAEHLDATWFAWVGATADDAVFYYRIHSPVILIEFDHQGPVGVRNGGRSRRPTRDHIHIIIRTPNGNDYGKDLLRQHLESHPH